MQKIRFNGQEYVNVFEIENKSPYSNTNVNFQILNTSAAAGGFQILSAVSTQGLPIVTGSTVNGLVGTMTPNQVVKIIVTYKVLDINNAPFTSVLNVTGTLPDGNVLNNSATRLVEYDNCPPAAGSTDAVNGCLCVDMREHSTLCSSGNTFFRLLPATVVNSVSYSFDDSTGKGYFTPVNPTLDITFRYVMECREGAVTTTIGSFDYTIKKQVESVDYTDHKLSMVKPVNLTLPERNLIKLQYPSLTDALIDTYCWVLSRNANGKLTSGIPLDCGASEVLNTPIHEAKDTQAIAAGAANYTELISVTTPTLFNSGSPLTFKVELFMRFTVAQVSGTFEVYDPVANMVLQTINVIYFPQLVSDLFLVNVTPIVYPNELVFRFRVQGEVATFNIERPVMIISKVV